MQAMQPDPKPDPDRASIRASSSISVNTRSICSRSPFGPDGMRRLCFEGPYPWISTALQPYDIPLPLPQSMGDSTLA